MDLHQRIILVDDLDLAAISGQQTGKQSRVHPRAIGTLKIVPHDDGDLGVRRAAAGASGDVERILAHVHFVELGQRLAVFGDIKLVGIALFPVDQGNGDGIVAGEFAGSRLADFDLHAVRHFKVGADVFLDAVAKIGGIGSARRASGLLG